MHADKTVSILGLCRNFTPVSYWCKIPTQLYHYKLLCHNWNVFIWQCPLSMNLDNIDIYTNGLYVKLKWNFCWVTHCKIYRSIQHGLLSTSYLPQSPLYNTTKCSLHRHAIVFIKHIDGYVLPSEAHTASRIKEHDSGHSQLLRLFLASCLHVAKNIHLFLPHFSPRWMEYVLPLLGNLPKKSYHELVLSLKIR